MGSQMSNQEPRSSLDDLLTPSLQEYTYRPAIQREKPWRLRSQLWVAFFGGVLPYTVIAYLNGQRLNLPASRLRQIVLLGIAGFLATIAVTYLITTSNTLFPQARSTTMVRLGSRIVAVLVYVIVYQLQKSADRIYQFSEDGAYASLWKAGLIATIGLGFLQNIIVYGIISLLIGL